MRKHLSHKELPNPLSKQDETHLLAGLQFVLERDIHPNNTQVQNVRMLNNWVAATLNDYDLKVEYAGPYGILPDKPLVSNPLFPEAANGIGCTDIDLFRGIIGDAIRSRESIYIPSILSLEEDDPEAHHECRKADVERQDMSEIVIVLPKTFKGTSVVQETYDLDIRRTNPFSESGVLTLEKHLRSALTICFPNPVEYEPTSSIHFRPPKRSP